MEVAAEMVIAVVEVVDASIVEVVGEARVRVGRPCFFGLPLPRPEPDSCPAINDLYNRRK